MQGFGIERALVYENGRGHFVFTDKTSLILHPRGDCFTYFRRDGKKLRQMTKYAINGSVKSGRSAAESGGPLDKLNLAL